MEVEMRKQWWLDLPDSKIIPTEFDELMRGAVNILKGKDDPRIGHIIGYMQHQQATGKKARRAEFAEEDPAPIPPTPLLSRRYRRF
jgi:hypothetical protein